LGGYAQQSPIECLLQVFGQVIEGFSNVIVTTLGANLVDEERDPKKPE
jgi:hypothetical protein